MELVSIWNWPATCLPDACFCEQVSSGLVKQPANTWSSFGFFAVGLWLLLSPSGSIPSMVRFAYVGCVMVVGITSAVFHASLTFVGQWLDVSSMYAYATLLACINLRVLGAVEPRGAAWLFVVVTAATSLLGGLVPSCRRAVFDVLLVVALLSMLRLAFTVWSGVSKRPLGLAIGALVLAMTAWILDLRHLWCRPGDVLHGHALWHLLGAFATACVFVYYRSGFGDTADRPVISGAA